MMRQQLSLKLEYFSLMFCHEKFKKQFKPLELPIFLSNFYKNICFEKDNAVCREMKQFLLFLAQTRNLNVNHLLKPKHDIDWIICSIFTAESFPGVTCLFTRMKSIKTVWESEFVGNT